MENYIAAAPQFAAKRNLSSIIGPSSAAGRVSPSAATDSHSWINVGPGNIGGRTRAILVQGTASNYTLFAGGVAGGIWKKSKDGNNWEPLDDLMANLAVTTLAQDPSNDKVIYAGTGEGFFNIGAVRGAGIFKTTDGGENWSPLSDTNKPDFYYVNKIVTSPNHSNTVYAATREGIFRSDNSGDTWLKKRNNRYSDLPLYLQYLYTGFPDLAVVKKGTEDYLYAWESFYGLLRSTSGGADWKCVICSTDSSSDLYRASIATSKSAPGTAYVLVSDNDGRMHKLFKTTNYFDSTPDTVIEWKDSIRYSANGLLLTNPCFPENSHQGWYDNVIAVDPTDANRVLAGGIELFRSDNGGSDFKFASYWQLKLGEKGAIHADHHAIVFAPDYDGSSKTTIFFGNDGGVYKSTNAHTGNVTDTGCSSSGLGIQYTSLNNNYGVTQFYHGSVPSSGEDYIGGTQDNGTLKYQKDGTTWKEIYGGDGGYTAIDPEDSNIMYYSYIEIDIQRSLDGGKNQTTIADKNSFKDNGGVGLFINPFALDPNSPGTMYLTNQYLWRSTNIKENSVTWTRIGGRNLGGGYGSAIGVPPRRYSGTAVAPALNSKTQYAGLFQNADQWKISNFLLMLLPVAIFFTLVRSRFGFHGFVKKWGILVAVLLITATFLGCGDDSGSYNGLGTVDPGNNTTGTVYVGTQYGRFFALVGEELKERTNGLPASYISSITVHPNDNSTVFVTISTFGVKHLWKTTDAGLSWTSLDGTTIPDIPAHSLFIDPLNTDHLYLGTDLGVLYSGNGGSSWESINTEGMANVVVEHLAYQHSTRRLFAFTHGRGVFYVELPS